MTGSSPALQAFWTSAYSVMQVLTIISAGACATHNGILEPSTRKAFAVFNIYVFFPCMCLGVAGSYDAAAVLRYLPLTAVAAAHIAIGLAVGHGAGRLLKLEAPDRQFLLLMTAFNNSAGMPFMLLVPLCKSWGRAVEEAERTDPSSVLSRCYCMVIIYGLVWTLGLFTIGVRIIRAAADAGG